MFMVGCTDNIRARNFGGTANLDLPPNQKLVNVTWKEDDIWYLTRPMRDDELAETYSFQESSSFGMLEGTVKIHEIKEEN
jgi:hypothetical protein